MEGSGILGSRATGQAAGQAAIYVCGLADLAVHASTLAPSHLISLVPPEEQPPTPACVSGDCHLRLQFDDIAEPKPGFILPEAGHVAALVDFVRGWPCDAPLLIHCLAGVSRSTAAALIALWMKSGGSEAAAARALRRAAPHAQPNERLIELADGLLGCEGRLVAARESMGSGNMSGMGNLVRLPVS